jgi:tetratricopeptide (TPR) repeat protein
MMLSQSYRHSKGSSIIYDSSNATQKSNLQSSNFELRLKKAHALLTSGEYAKAVRGYSAALEVNSSCLDALFNRAVSYMHLSNYELAKLDFLDLASENSLYDPEVYTSLAVCHQATGQPDHAMRCLDIGISSFPEFVKSYVLRGHMQLQEQRVDKAITDFHRAVQLDMKEATAYVGLGDCFKLLGDWKSAINAYSQAVSVDRKERRGLRSEHKEPSSQGRSSPQYKEMTSLVRRALVYLSRRQFAKADRDLVEYLRYVPSDAEAQFYRGQVLLAQGQDNEASLAFEQAIKNGESSIFHKAIFFLGFIKIQHKDFYGALHTFDRAPKHKLREQLALELYAEAVVDMMKRKHAEGVQKFSQLIKMNSTVMRELKASCLSCRAFGLACINKHTHAVRDLLRSQQITKLNGASQYNLNISSVFLAAEQNDFKTADRCINKLILLCPNNAEPYCYKAIVILLRSAQTKTDKVEHALKLVSKAIELKGTECEFYLLRGLIHYSLRRTVEAVSDIETAMDKAEDNEADFLVIRGLCFAQLKLYEDAIQDFMYAVKLNSQMEVAYAFIAKCLSLLENSELDLSKVGDEWLKSIQSVPQETLDHIEFGLERYALSYIKLSIIKCRPEVPWLNRIDGRVQFTDAILDLPTIVSSRASSVKSAELNESINLYDNESYVGGYLSGDDLSELHSEDFTEAPKSL